MPTNEIKELRKAGRLDEAYEMAKTESTSVWGKRNLSWVLYDQMGKLVSDLNAFLEKINEVKELDLPVSEELFFENISIVIAKAARANSEEYRIYKLFNAIKTLPIKRNSKWYIVLFKAFHRELKKSNKYIEFADWWDFKNFRPEDFQKEKMLNGQEVLAVAEQAYIAYSKNLLPKYTPNGEIIFDREKVDAFLPELSRIMEENPHFQYPAYFNAKLLMAIGNMEKVIETLLPFAKKKRNDFWVWDLLGEAFSNDPEKEFACYCRALTCNSPPEMLVSVRQKIAKKLISRKLYNEARTEIDLLVQIKTERDNKIPMEVTKWKNMDWYKEAVPVKSNFDFYKNYKPIAEDLLFSDVPEEVVIVEFVNSDRKIIYFIQSETKFGFFKYERFLSDVKVGDTLKVRFQGGSNGGKYQIYTAIKSNDDEFKKQFFREISGVVKIPAGKQFGFLEDVYIHPSIVKKYHLVDGRQFSGKALKSYNREKNQWGWRVIHSYKS